SYRREKFTENEGNSTDFGFDLMLSTLLPITSVVKSAETSALNFNSLNYATFFNVEGSFWFSLGYHWALYANVGRYSYETRKQNQQTLDNPSSDPLFQKFELEAVPAIAGIRYRLSREDLVPYVSLGIGLAYVHRKGSNEAGTNNTDEEYQTVACGHGAVGLEFFFAPKAGLRVEASAYYFNLPLRTFDPQGTIGVTPQLQYQSNVWSLRYASGVFFLF
ncbi:MAG: outer membrane beta-barrel protein, partial [Deltaproteobacteria bacterium]